MPKQRAPETAGEKVAHYSIIELLVGECAEDYSDEVYQGFYAACYRPNTSPKSRKTRSRQAELAC